jgi:HEPN domain-containing protein/predicted nucleotidyltransferase
MKTSIDHLPKERQSVINQTLKIILDNSAPEKIILFGSHATGKWIDDVQLEDGLLTRYISDYDFLVIAKANEQIKENILEGIIDKQVDSDIIISIISHDIIYVNEMLSKGQYFFSEITTDGILLFDDKNIPLSKIGMAKLEDRRDIAKNDKDLWLGDAKEFFIAAQNALLRKKLRMSTFFLHQAAEGAFNAIILVFRGYKPKTHNLKKLYKYTKSTSEKLAAIFPQYIAEEKYLFETLIRGYVDARYVKGFEITEEHVNMLLKRVSQLQEIAEEICAEKIASFK